MLTAIKRGDWEGSYGQRYADICVSCDSSLHGLLEGVVSQKGEIFASKSGPLLAPMQA